MNNFYYSPQKKIDQALSLITTWMIIKDYIKYIDL